MAIEFSENVEGRDLKILMWGEAGSWKTETGLRNFPHCLLIDVEGNSDQVIGHPDVPPFLRVVTKDIYEILDTLDQVEVGEIQFPDGTPVETVIIDGISVLWSVRQETGSLMAEERAKRYARGRDVNPDDVNMTMLDWTKAKRPLKRLHAKMNVPGVKYFIVTARSKDLYEEVEENGKTVMKKTGLTMDAMRGLDFEVNLALQMFGADGCEVTKAQGILGKKWPKGTHLDAFPAEELLAYATGSQTVVQDELDVARENYEHEATRTKSDLVNVGKEHGLSPAEVAEALDEADLAFDPNNWDAMVAAVKAHNGAEVAE